LKVDDLIPLLLATGFAFLNLWVECGNVMWFRLEPMEGACNEGSLVIRISKVHRLLTSREQVNKTISAVCAVKTIPKSSIVREQALARFDRDVRAIVKLRHPGIIHVHAFLTDDLY
jgi:serine/threonine protein kinase